MIATLFVIFMLALGLLTVWLDSGPHGQPRNSLAADFLGAIWLVLLIYGSLVLIVQ